MPKAKESRPRVLLVNRCIVKKDNKILIIKRSSKDSNYPGKWEIPGGKLEIGHDPSYSLETEVLEECGLYIKVGSPKFFVESQVILEGKYEGLPYITIVGEANVVGGEVKLSHEHEDYRWIDPKDINQFEATEITKKALATLQTT